ncbi:hypothetical protein [Methylogaea oryzae]|uniref:Uncharacterized protein n=1 Tax=Methylogaea oryzae TaxID=1295382 RepID=A0A8D4VN75_9GAMM|nr:hypothetical protein [Methylogaea oryzae]BBL70314.1 hypothetical protein MoryE10_09200 [Methylogaea oryzae]
MEVQTAAQFARRLRGLKARALGSGFAGLAACSGAFIQIALVLNGAYETWMRQEGLPPFDIPLSVSVQFVYEVLQLITLFLLVAAIAGFSLGAFPRHRARWVFLLPAVLLAVTAWWTPPASRWLHLLPSTLDRYVRQARYDEAEHIIGTLNLARDSDGYLRAQIALRVGDTAALRKLGEPLLAKADDYVYQIDRGNDPVGAPQIPEYAPEVVYAVDRALHGQPETQVGIAWEQRSGDGEKLAYWLEFLTRGLLSLFMAFLGGGALLIWNAMRQRISRIEAALTA